MGRMQIASGLMALALALPAAGFAAPAAATAKRTVYAKRDDVSLRKGPDRTAPEVAKLPSGTALGVLQEDGPRLRVSSPRGEGFVLTLHVTPEKPAKGKGAVLLKDDLGPGERSNIASIRGLSASAEQAARTAGTPETAIEDAKKIEEIGAAVQEADVDAFLTEGKVEAQ